MFDVKQCFENSTRLFLLLHITNVISWSNYIHKKSNVNINCSVRLAKKASARGLVDQMHSIRRSSDLEEYCVRNVVHLTAFEFSIEFLENNGVHTDCRVILCQLDLCAAQESQPS